MTKNEFLQQVQKAKWLVHNNRIDDASTLVPLLQSAEHSRSDIHYLLALIFFKKGDYANSLIELERAQIIAPDQPRILRLIFDCYLRLEKAKEAEKTGKYLESVETPDLVDFSDGVYLKSGKTLEDVVGSWNNSGIAYVSLDDIQSKTKLEQISECSFLIHDDSLGVIAEDFVSRPTTENQIRLNIYSNSGKKGALLNKLPYLPVYLANKILLDKNSDDFICQPSDEHKLLLMMYKYVFLVSDPIVKKSIKNKIQKVTKSLGVNLSVTDEVIYQYLSNVGWVPETDMFRRLASSNPNLIQRAPKPTRFAETGDAEMGVFILRDWLAQEKHREYFKKRLEHIGFEIISDVDLPNEEKIKAGLYINGGFWNEDNSEIFKSFDSGMPSAILIVMDYHPLTPEGNKYSQSLYTTNLRYNFLEVIRRELMSNFMEKDSYSEPFHYSVDELEALHYIEICAPDLKSEVLKEIQDRNQAMESSFPVKEVLKKGDRGKVELIEYKGEIVVKKTFKKHCLHYLEREILATTKLADELKIIPKAIETGSNFIIMPYIDDRFKNNVELKKEILTKNAAYIGTLYRYLYEKGLMHLDLHPDHFMYCPETGIKLIDFDFLQPYKEMPSSVGESYDVKSVPESFDGDQPRNHIMAAEDYDYQKVLNNMWYDYTGYTIAGLVLKSLEGSRQK